LPIFNINDEKSAEARRGREFKIPFSLKKREIRAKNQRFFAYIILKRKGIVKEKK